MAVPRLAVLAALTLAPAQAAAEGNCTTVDLDLLPGTLADNPYAPQIVAWVEQPDGTFVDTIFITARTGTYGIGNRPGRFDFNSGPNWPYGRRITVFPVWAHRHGLTWDEVRFQNADESNLSHPFNESSKETHFCRPLQPNEPSWDAFTCASQVFTDKGLLSDAKVSLYPPRNDVETSTPDDPVVDMFDLLNPFDSISQATPPPGTLATLSWPVPETLPFGEYVMFVEVSREFDMNDAYNATQYPSPIGIPWMDYGEPYRGQPSVVYRVPFTIDSEATTSAATSDYVGYGDPDGLDGNLRAPDATISTTVPGSGAARLQLVSVDGQTFRVRLTARPQFDFEAPALPAAAEVIGLTANEARIAFVAPGDDGTAAGKVSKYEIRYRVGSAMTPENFDTATLVPGTISPAQPGAIQTFSIPGLLPSTEYSVGIRAVDDCRNVGEIAIVDFLTPERGTGEVDACFVATAAYGSSLAGDVDMLRRFRDLMLKQTAFGELAVETYYTFGPALSGLIGESDLLRATARDALAPVVSRVRGLKVSEPR